MAVVTIYTTRTCPYCKQLKEFLEENGVAFTSYSVDVDFEKAQEMIEISGQRGVPVTIIKDDDGIDHQVVGFDKSKIEGILHI